jgi:hypothetical protein
MYHNLLIFNYYKLINKNDDISKYYYCINVISKSLATIILLDKTNEL